MYNKIRVIQITSPGDAICIPPHAAMFPYSAQLESLSYETRRHVSFVTLFVLLAVAVWVLLEFRGRGGGREIAIIR